MCTVLLPPGVNTIAVKYIIITIFAFWRVFRYEEHWDHVYFQQTVTKDFLQHQMFRSNLWCTLQLTINKMKESSYTAALGPRCDYLVIPNGSRMNIPLVFWGTSWRSGDRIIGRLHDRMIGKTNDRLIDRKAKEMIVGKTESFTDWLNGWKSDRQKDWQIQKEWLIEWLTVWSNEW
jgi:hypothetical protein